MRRPVVWYSDDEVPELDEPVHDHLVRRPYPGNVRDLKHLAARIAYRHVGAGPITVGSLPENERPEPAEEDATWHDSTFDASVRRALAQGVGLRVTDKALQMRRAASRQNGSAKTTSTGFRATAAGDARVGWEVPLRRASRSPATEPLR
jgi:transcriptional regulator with PAS, ATPase and Fis domain